METKLFNAFGLPVYWEEMPRDERVAYLYDTRHLNGWVVA